MIFCDDDNDKCKLMLHMQKIKMIRLGTQHQVTFARLYWYTVLAQLC